MVKPEAGQWWASTMGNRVQIVGVKADGMVVFETRGGNYNDEHIQEITGFWTHMKDCTGWDWQPDTEPEWFDLTPFGEHRLRKDIDQYEKNRDDVWLPIRVYEGATIDGMKSIWGHDQKFRCLLKDAPPELVAMVKQTESVYGFCPNCGARGKSRERRINGMDACENGHLYPSRDALKDKPSESPDDWVTQDRVPYRKGVDEFRWERLNGTFVGPWSNLETNPRMHGYVDGLNDRFQVRCRRRDLPPLPQQPKTEREVLLYWYDGNVVGRYAHCPPTDLSFVPLVIRDGKVFIETETREVVNQ